MMIMKVFPLKQVFSRIPYSFKAPLAFSFILELISGLQLVFMVLKASFNQDDKSASPIVTFIIALTSYAGEIDSQNFDEGQLSSLSQVIWAIWVAYFILHFILILITLIRENGLIKANKTSTLLKVMSILYLIHSKIIFFVAHYFLLSLINSYNDCKDTMTGSFYCHPAWLAITVVLCLVNLSLAVTIELCLYQITKNKNTYAIKTNYFHRNVLFHKTLALLFYFLIEDSGIIAKTSSITSLILSLIGLLILFWKLPFYNLTILKTCIVTTSIVVSSSFVSFLKAVGIDYKGSDHIWLSATLVLIFAAVCFYNRTSENILKGQFTSPESAIFFVSLLKQCDFGYIPPFVFKEKFERGTLVFRGFLEQEHYDVEAAEKLASGLEGYKANMYILIREKLNKVLQKNPDSRILLMYLARIEMKKLHNIPNTLKYIKRINGLSKSVPVEGASEDLMTKIKGMFKRERFGNYEYQKKFQLYFKSRKKAADMKNKILYEVNNHLKFWDDMKRDPIDIMDTVDLAYEIDRTAAQIHKAYEEYGQEFREHFVSTLLVYGIYTSMVHENTRNAKRILQTFLTISQMLTQDHAHFNIYSEDTALLTLSLDKATPGKVLDASSSVQELFENDKSQILGNGLAHFLPITTANSILELINMYLEAPTQNFCHQITQKYGKTKKGQFFEMDIYLQLYPKIDGDVKLLALFRKISDTKNIIIVDPNGVITECSSGLKDAFQLRNEDEGHIKLQKICPDFKHINAAFNIIYGKDKHAKKIKHSVTTQSLMNIPKAESSEILDDMGKDTEEDVAFHIPAFSYHGSYRAHPSAQSIQSPQGTSLAQEKPKSFFHKLIEDTFHSSQMVHIPQESANEICDKFIDGNYLGFRSLDASTTHHHHRHHHSLIQYKVEITPYEIGREIYKMLILTEKDEKQHDPQVGSQNKLITHKDTNNVTHIKKIGSKILFQVPQDHKEHREEGDSSPKLLKLQVNRAAVRRNAVSHKKSGTTHKLSGSHRLLGSPTLGKKKQDLGKVSIGSSTSRLEHSVRKLKLMFDHRGSYTLLKKAAIVLYLMMSLLVVLGVANYLISKSAIKEVKTNFHIVDLANLRLSSAMDSWQSATRFFLRYANLRTGGFQDLQESVYEESISMLDTNKKFSKDLSSDIPHDLLMMIFKQNVTLWDVNQTTIFNGAPTDTFVATNYLAQKMLKVANASDVETSEMIEEVRYVVNNTGNDYLISSDAIIQDTEDILEISIQDNVSTLKYLLTGESLTIVLLCVLVLILAALILKAYRKLFHALTKIEIEHIINRQHQLHRLKEVISHDIESKKFCFEALELLDKTKIQENAKEERVGASHHLKEEPKFLMGRLIRYLIRYSVTSFIFVQIFVVLFVISQVKSLATFDAIDTARSQLSLSSKAKSQVSEVLCAFYMNMVFRGNSIMLVRNQDTGTFMSEALDTLHEVSTAVTAAFSENGDYPTNTTVKTIIYNDICSYVPTETKDYCFNATGGSDMGFFTVNQKLLSILDYYMAVYLENPTWDTANAIMDAYATLSRPCTETVEAAYDLLNSYVLLTVNESISDFNIEQNALYLGLLAAVVICTLLIQFVTFDHFYTLHTGRGKILKVFPLAMLLESKVVSYYLNSQFLNKFK